MRHALFSPGEASIRISPIPLPFVLFALTVWVFLAPMVRVSADDAVIANGPRDADLRRLPPPHEPDVITETLTQQLEASTAFDPVQLVLHHHPASSSDGPSHFDVTGRDVKITFRSVIQIDAIHDFNAVGLEPDDRVFREFITAEIPVGGAAARRDNRSTLSPNQSIIEGMIESPTPYGDLYAYARGNLTKDPTATEFQVYLAFVTWGWVKAGFDRTLWLNRGAQPSTLDFEGPNAVPWVRYPQFSLKIPWTGSMDDSCWFSVIGVESAPVDITLPLEITNRNAVNRLPTSIGKLTYETDRVQIEMAGLYRLLRAQGDDYESSVNGWGVSLSGGFDTWGKDRFVISAALGEGIGAYNQDTAGFGLDAAPRSALNPTLKAIPAVSGWLGYQHWWTSFLRSSTTYGYVGLDNAFDMTVNPVGIYQQAHYASTNLVWSPVPYVDVGIEYLFGQREVTAATAVNGQRVGKDHRVHATIRWNFSNRP